MSRQMGIPAKKRFGQHFLRDTGILDRIIRGIDPSPQDTLIEIGAGRGALSVRLAPLVSYLLAIELDRDCIPILEDELGPFPSAKVLNQDFLKLEGPPVLPGLSIRKTRVVGNLPYNISTTIIERVLAWNPPVWDMTAMVQMEVAQRIVAVPCTKEYGFFSLLCQHAAEVKLLFRVPPQCFVPRPKVMSAVLTLRPKPRSWSIDLDDVFIRVVKAAFSYRRKTLANSFLLSNLDAQLVSSCLERAGLTGGERAEELTLAQYEKLAVEFHNTRLFS